MPAFVQSTAWYIHTKGIIQLSQQDGVWFILFIGTVWNGNYLIVWPLTKTLVSVEDPLILVAVTLSSHLDGPRYRKRQTFGSKSECSAINNWKYNCKHICHNLSRYNTQKTMDISFISPLLEHPLRRLFVSVEDPLSLVNVTLSSHLDVEKPVILGKIRIIHNN